MVWAINGELFYEYKHKTKWEVLSTHEMWKRITNAFGVAEESFPCLLIILLYRRSWVPSVSNMVGERGTKQSGSSSWYEVPATWSESLLVLGLVGIHIKKEALYLWDWILSLWCGTNHSQVLPWRPHEQFSFRSLNNRSSSYLLRK